MADCPRSHLFCRPSSQGWEEDEYYDVYEDAMGLWESRNEGVPPTREEWYLEVRRLLEF